MANDGGRNQWPMMAVGINGNRLTIASSPRFSELIFEPTRPAIVEDTGTKLGVNWLL